MARVFSSVTAEEMAAAPSIKINVPEVNLSKITGEDGGISFKLNAVPEEPKKKRASSSNNRKAAESVANAVTDTVSHSDDMLTTNTPYETKYQETTGLLKVAIGQLDGILNDTLVDSRELRASKTLKRKYDLLSLLNSNASNIIGNKISAVREINSTISKCNELELRRMKELNFAAANDNSDKKIMDMYNAFVTMPVGDPSNNAQSLQYISNAISSGNVVTSTISGGDDVAYQQYLGNMNPAQKLNMYESDPNVKQVVVYNQETGAKYFEVMNMATGEVIPGVDKHDSMFLEDVTFDWENKIARNINIGETFPLVVVGEPVLNMY